MVQKLTLRHNINICLVESKICPRFAFVESKICPSFPLVSLFCFQESSFCRENEIFSKKNKEDKTDHFLESKLCPIMLCNMLGQIFDSILDRFLIQPFSHFWHIFSFSKYARTTLFIGFSAKIAICNPPPKD